MNWRKLLSACPDGLPYVRKKDHDLNDKSAIGKVIAIVDDGIRKGIRVRYPTSPWPIWYNDRPADVPTDKKQPSGIHYIDELELDKP